MVMYFDQVSFRNQKLKNLSNIVYTLYNLCSNGLLITELLLNLYEIVLKLCLMVLPGDFMEFGRGMVSFTHVKLIIN